MTAAPLVLGRVGECKKDAAISAAAFSRKLEAILTHAERLERWLIDGGCDIKPVILLISRQGRTGEGAKDTVDLSGVITLFLERGLHIPDYLVGGQIVVSVDRAVVRIIGICIVAPGRIPPPGIPEVPATIDEHDPVMMVPPPVPIMPLCMIVSECLILFALPVLAAVNAPIGPEGLARN